MMSPIAEYDCRIDVCERQTVVVAEMKTQIGYSRFLREIGKTTSDRFKRCQELYPRARDVTIKLGGASNFPKRIGS